MAQIDIEKAREYWKKRTSGTQGGVPTQHSPAPNSDDEQTTTSELSTLDDVRAYWESKTAKSTVDTARGNKLPEGFFDTRPASGETESGKVEQITPTQIVPTPSKPTQNAHTKTETPEAVKATVGDFVRAISGMGKKSGGTAEEEALNKATEAAWMMSREELGKAITSGKLNPQSGLSNDEELRVSNLKKMISDMTNPYNISRSSGNVRLSDGSVIYAKDYSKTLNDARSELSELETKQSQASVANSPIAQALSRIYDYKYYSEKYGKDFEGIKEDITDYSGNETFEQDWKNLKGAFALVTNGGTIAKHESSMSDADKARLIYMVKQEMGGNVPSSDYLLTDTDAAKKMMTASKDVMRYIDDYVVPKSTDKAVTWIGDAYTKFDENETVLGNVAKVSSNGLGYLAQYGSKLLGAPDTIANTITDAFTKPHGYVGDASKSTLSAISSAISKGRSKLNENETFELTSKLFGEDTAKKISSGVGFVQGITDSVVDNVLTYAIFQGIAPVVQGATAASDSMYSQTERGISADKVLAVGIASAAAEYLGERAGLKALDEISTNALLNSKTKREAFVKALLPSALNETLNESSTSALNLAADWIILGDSGEIAEAANEAIKSGKHSERDVAIALYCLGTIAKEGIAGGISGGALSGLRIIAPGSKVGKRKPYRVNPTTPSRTKTTGEASPETDTAETDTFETATLETTSPEMYQTESVTIHTGKKKTPKEAQGKYIGDMNGSRLIAVDGSYYSQNGRTFVVNAESGAVVANGNSFESAVNKVRSNSEFVEASHIEEDTDTTEDTVSPENDIPDEDIAEEDIAATDEEDMVEETAEETDDTDYRTAPNIQNEEEYKSLPRKAKAHAVIGRSIAESDFENDIIEMGLDADNSGARNIANSLRNNSDMSDVTRYVALGDLASRLGVTKEQIVRAKARSLAFQFASAISDKKGATIAERVEAAIPNARKTATARNDRFTLDALGYLESVVSKGGTAVSELVYRTTDTRNFTKENPNTAVERYAQKMQSALRASGTKINVVVAYDMPIGARGDWTTKNGVTTIRLNGKALRGEASAFWVMSHELLHEAETYAPGITDRILDTFEDMGIYTDGMYEAYRQRYKSSYEAAYKGRLDSGEINQAEYDRLVDRYVKGEIAADLMSECFTSRDMLEMFAGKLTVEDRNIIVRFLKKIVEGLKKAFGETDAYTARFEAIVSEFENAIKSGSGTNVGEQTRTKRKSLSSIGYSFFGNESISADEVERMLEDGSYKDYEGYKKYVEDCVKVYKQAYGNATEADIAQIEKEIEGIMRVAVAAKRAGYDIFDSGEKRNITDSKDRLLFSSLEPNSDYITSSDISTICDKRMNFAEIYDDIVKLEEQRGVPEDERFFHNVDNYFIIHKIMADKGLTVPCEECYVESMRKNLAPMAEAFITLVKESDDKNKSNPVLYHQDGKDKGKKKKNNAELRNKVRRVCAEKGFDVNSFTLEMLSTAEGLAQLRLQQPLLYEAFNSFYGQSKPKMPREATPFRPGELIALLTNDKGKINTSLLEKIKSTGGFRLQSYSDFQIKNYVDVLQTIFEASMLGLNGHAYTKVPAFLQATEGTNLKRNLSIFMYDDNGTWTIDKKNSFPMELEDIYALVAEDESGNTSIIAVSQNEKMSAWVMANNLIGYSIPFHKSGLKMEVVRARVVKTKDGREVLGYAEQKDHTSQQNEVYKKNMGGKKKEGTKVTKPINIYSFWDFDNKDGLSQKELIEKNLKKYIDECEKAFYRPKFREYLMDNEAVLNDVLRYAKELGSVDENATIDDISFEYGEYRIPYGYYKFLGDFGMFTPDGEASPIKPLSLAEYDFDKAVEFFADSKKLRTNELLQQFENGAVREKYRKMVEDGELTAEQLEEIIRGKRSEVVREVVDGERRSALFGEDLASNGSTISPDTRYALSNPITPEMDAEYLELAKNPKKNEARLREMVEEAARKAGYTRKMFHETDAENIHIFDISMNTHGETDSETPYGIFTKSSDKSIGLGSRQMALFVKAERTLNVANRQDVKNKIPELLPYYDEIARIDREYDALIEKLEDAEMDILYEWLEEHPDVDMDEVYSNEHIAKGKPADIDSQEYLDAHNAYAKAMEEWKQKYGEIAVKCKEIITSYLRDNNYDSMYFEVDGGSRGRQTDSLILLDKNQVKSADTITYDDDGNIIPLSERFNPESVDIRNALSNTEVLEEQEELMNKYGIAPTAPTKQKVFYSKQGDSEWKTERTKGNTAKTKSLGEITNDIRKRFGIPISTGNFTARKGTRGIYKVREQAIRTRISNDLRVEAHELGHHLDNLYNLANLPHLSDAGTLLPENVIVNYPDSEIPHEMVAEFVYRYLQNREAVSNKFPELVKEFESKLSKKDLKSIRELADEINAYMSSSFREQLLTSIVTSKEAKKESEDALTRREKLQYAIEEFRAKYVDKFEPILNVLKTANADTEAYTLAMNSLSWQSRANYLLNGNFVSLDGKVIGKSFIDCLVGIEEKDLSLFDAYLKLRHIPEWNREGLTVSPNPKFSNAETINEEIAKIEEEHPEFIKAAESIYEYNDNLLSLLVESGLISEEFRQELKAKYPFYVPFRRNLGNAKQSFIKARAGLANQNSTIRKAKGSGLDTYSPLESIIANTFEVMKASQRNSAMQAIASVADTIEGFGSVMENVTPSMSVKHIDLNHIREDLRDALDNILENGVVELNDGANLDEMLEAVVQDFNIYSVAQGANNNRKIVTVMRNGKPSYYQIHDDLLHKALTAFSPKQANGFIRFMQAFGRLQKTAITTLNPVFSVSNFIRDFDTAYKIGDYTSLSQFTANYVKSFIDVIRKTPEYKLYRAMGGGNSSELSANRDMIKRSLRELSSKNARFAERIARGFVNKLIHPINTIADMNDFVEQVPRYMQFVRTYQETGDVQKAIFEADRATTNFKRGGTSTPTLNALFKFSNASIQGLDNTVRKLMSSGETPKELLSILYKMLLVDILKAALLSWWNYSKDKKGYDNLSNFMKNNYYVIALGDGKFIRLPKARELSVVSTLAQRTIDATFGGDKEAFVDFGGYIFDLVNPGFLPLDWSSPQTAIQNVVGNIPLVGTIAEIGLNVDYKGSKIVPDSMRYEIPENQYYNTTSETAKVIGKLFKISPLQVDHFINSFGVLGTINQSVLAIDKNQIDKTLGFARRYSADSVYSTDVYNRVYDRSAKAEAKYNRDASAQNAVEYEKYNQTATFITKAKGIIREAPFDEQRAMNEKLQRIISNMSFAPTESDKLVTKLDTTDIFKFEAKNPELTYKGESKKMSFDDYVEYMSEWQNAQQMLRIICFGSKSDLTSDVVKEARALGVGNVLNTPNKKLTDEQKVDLYTSTFNKIESALRDKYKKKYFPDS